MKTSATEVRLPELSSPSKQDSRMGNSESELTMLTKQTHDGQVEASRNASGAAGAPDCPAGMEPDPASAGVQDG